MGCESEFIGIIDTFINRKKCGISDANNDNNETENDSYHSCTKTSISAINPNNPNLYIRKTNIKLRSKGKTTVQQIQNVYHLSKLATRTSFHTFNSNLNETSVGTS
ncbi:hypothetical protein C2G38_2195619 [Gigaspora rosea]|uniref:Uncharacterized protein n=1 Tax=Gigaspora rosea TaxID=44941 RepID=A0A397UYM5_9GLOM|nr:hypothetical protein C2G38_2195619 [Gigaspora rosea]